MYKSININTLNVCDIVLTTSTAFQSKAIRFGINSDISHAMICVARGSVIDSTGDGVHSRNVQRLFYDESCSIYIMRLKKQLSEDEKSKIIMYIRTQIGVSYGIKEAFKSISNPSSKGSDLQFCSRLAARAFAEIGVNISDNPDFCTPDQIKKSPYFFEVLNAFITVTEEEKRMIEAPGSTLDDMREVTNKLLELARIAAPKVKILSVNDINIALLENNSLDDGFADAFVKSGYLDHWKKDVIKHMYRYDIKIMEKYILINPGSLEIFIEYCQKTLEDEEKGIINHWRKSQSDFRDLSKNLKTFKLNYQLYDNLVRCRVPCDHVPRRSWPLFKARAVLRGLLASNDLESTS